MGEAEQPKGRAFKARLEALAVLASDTSFGMLVTLAVALVLASMSAAGVITMVLARALLGVAWVVMIITLVLAPPVRQVRTSRKWVSAVALTAMLIAMERYETLNQPMPPLRLGPHMEFHGFSQSTDSGLTLLRPHIDNVNDIAAVSVAFRGVAVVSDSENDANNQDVTSAISDLETEAKAITLAHSNVLQITRGMGINPPAMAIADVDIQKVKSGQKKLYFTMIAVYIDAQNSPDQFWVTETCARVVNLPGEFETCPRFNRYFLSDRSLNQIN